MTTLENKSHSNLLQQSPSFMDSIQSEDLKRSLLWHGIFLCTLGFIAGLFLPLYANPRAGLATHLLGITQGLFLAIVGLIYPHLKLSFTLARVNFWMLLISAYVGMVGEFMGAAFGLTKVFIITAQGFPPGSPWMENTVEIAIKGISTFILLSCFIILYGLRRIKSDSNSL
jgi:hydroxylaminobenzene mutase